MADENSLHLLLGKCVQQFVSEDRQNQNLN